MTLETDHLDDMSDDAWTALMVAIALTLSEMDYSPPEMRTASKFLQRMDELLAESFQLQRFPSLTLDGEEHALRLAQAMRNSVQSARDSIRSDYGEPS